MSDAIDDGIPQIPVDPVDTPMAVGGHIDHSELLLEQSLTETLYQDTDYTVCIFFPFVSANELISR